MGARIREFNWAETPLGPPQHWPQSLKTSIRIMLMSQQPVWIGWGAELFYFYNDPYLSIIGGKHPWALGNPTREVWHEIWDVIGPMLATAMSGDEGTYVEEQLLVMERNGYPEETYYTFSYSPIPNDEGLPGGIICANSDDTQRVVSQRELSLLRDLSTRTAPAKSAREVCERSIVSLRTNLKDLPFSAIYLVNEELGVADLMGATHPAASPEIIPEAVQLDDMRYGFRTALSSQSFHLLENLGPLASVPCGDWPIARNEAIVLPLIAGGEATRGGILLVGLNPYRLLDDGYSGFLNLVGVQIAAAIAEADAAERERQRLEALAELDRAKTAFFSNVSHEFRTPLTLMLGPLEDVLAGRESLPPRVRQDLETVRRNGLRLQKLVNSLLDFSRLEAGRMRAVFQPTDLASYTADLASAFDSAVRQGGLDLIVDCEPIAPEQAYVDHDLWEKVVLNLLSNAFKHTFSGSITVAVRLEGPMVELLVRDTGIGISGDDLPHIFERFRRVEGSQARTHEGSGIGLALVYEIVKLHGGEIEAQSQTEGENRGTSFRIRLPVGSAHLPEGQVRRDRSAPRVGSTEAFTGEAMRWLPEFDAEGSHWAGGLADSSPRTAKSIGARILVADDNADMREYLGRLLGQAYDLEFARDGAAVLESLNRTLPELLITDVMMPQLDGLDLVEAIRRDSKMADLPIIMLSARAGEEAKIEGLGAGADDYLVKPFSSRELIAKVDSAIALSRLRMEATTALRARESELRDALASAEERQNRIEELAHELEQRVEQRTAELLHSNEQLQGFTYSIAHDLRQQIRGININASCILDDLGEALEDHSKVLLNRLVRSAKQLGLLVDDLLQYARLAKMAPSYAAVDLSEVATEIAEHLRSRDAAFANIEFKVADGITASGDPLMLRLVLENLLDNAGKYSAQCPQPVVEFGEDGRGFFVRDNGIGFDMAYSHKLFQPFERLHGDEAIPGTGIGLANVKRIVEKHGGVVFAESSPGQGATFYFTLPTHQ